MHRRRQVHGSVDGSVATGRVAIGPPEVEHRFAVDALQAQAFLACVAPHVALERHDVDRPVQHLVTTYFDTPAARFFHSSGRLGRARVRVRQYAAAAGPDDTPLATAVCAFEVKMSIFESRRIARLVDRPQEIEHLLWEGGWRFDLQLGQLSALWRAARAIASGKLRPVLTTYARREARTAPGIRITIDDEVAFAQPAALVPAGRPVERDRVFMRNADKILEVKLTAAPPRWLREAMRLLRQPRLESSFHEGMRAAQRIEALAAAARAAAARRRLQSQSGIAFE